MQYALLISLFYLDVYAQNIAIGENASNGHGSWFLGRNNGIFLNTLFLIPAKISKDSLPVILKPGVTQSIVIGENASNSHDSNYTWILGQNHGNFKKITSNSFKNM